MDVWGRPRCVWCHDPGELKPLHVRVSSLSATTDLERTASVHPAHEEAARRFFNRAHRAGRAFLGSVLLGLVAPSVFLAFRWLPGLGAALAYLGVVMLLFSFSTEATRGLVGIRNSVRLTRAFGPLFIVAGAALLWIV